jgi:hypothetical protein
MVSSRPGAPGLDFETCKADTAGMFQVESRAVGMRRSMQRMKNLEGRLRDDMTRNGIGPEAPDNIMQGISS